MSKRSRRKGITTKRADGTTYAEKTNRLAQYQDDIEWVRERLRSEEFDQAMADYIAAGDDADERRKRAEQVVRISEAIAALVDVVGPLITALRPDR